LHDFRLVVTAGRYIDVLPHCFSKGQALRFLAASAGVDLKRVAAAGDMEHDEDMLRIAGHAIIPHNALPPLRRAMEGSHAYFAEGREALGVMEGLRRIGLV
jgi:sucrose-phosphate synthase